MTTKKGAILKTDNSENVTSGRGQFQKGKSGNENSRRKHLEKDKYEQEKSEQGKIPLSKETFEN